MATVFQPSGQKTLTNVSVVRLKRAGKRFEIACYKNKVLSYRAGHERDLDEVLQVEEVFSNVSKGMVASKPDLLKAFDTDNRREVVLRILEKGELQVSDKERQYTLQNTFHEIATIIANKTVDRSTQRPFPLGVIEKALREVHFSVQAPTATRSSKMQALDAIKTLRVHSELDIERARMRMRVRAPLQRDAKALRESLTSAKLIDRSESEDWMPGGALVWTFQCDPGAYRTIEDAVSRDTRGKGSVEVLSLSVLREGEEAL